MSTKIPHIKTLVVGVLAAGALSFGAAGIAGAGTPAAAPPAAAAHAAATHAAATHAARTLKRRKHFTCADATKVLSRIDKAEAHIAAGLPKLTAAQAKAAKDGHTVRAARLERRITRLESAKFKSRLTRVSAKIEAKCHVSAPAAGTSAAA
jgi:hypothetical protein